MALCLRPIKEVHMARAGKSGLFLCLVLAFWLGTASAVEQENTTPIIEIETPTYNFEEVSQGETVKHTFNVRNTGTAPLQIKGVKPG